MKKLLAIACALALSVVSATAAEKLVVVTGGGSPSISFIPIYVAQQTGMLEEDGVDLEFQYAGGAPAAAQLAAANQVDIAMLTVEPVIYGYEQGLEGKLFLRINDTLIYYIAVPADSDIETLADLEGENIGVFSLGSAGLPATKSMLSLAGVDVSDDQLVPVGLGEQALTALRQGNVTALSLYNGAYYAMERAGNEFRYFHHPVIGDMGNSAMFASDAAIAEKRDLLCAFGRSYAKGLLFTETNPEAAARMFWNVVESAKRGDDDEEALANTVAEIEQILSDTEGTYPPEGAFGRIDPESMAAYMQVLQEEGAATSLPAIDDVVDFSFVDCVNDFDGADVISLAQGWTE